MNLHLESAGKSLERWSLSCSGGRTVSWDEALAGWRSGEGDRFAKGLAESSFQAAYWECPPLVTGNLEAPCHGVLVDAPPLAGLAEDPNAFREHFRGPGPATFRNLGGDALLVAPVPDPDADAAHFLAYCRTATRDLLGALFRQVAAAVLDSLDEHSPLWLSTSGLGVAWLHVRLDASPKYYQYAPFRDPGLNFANGE
ncbi:MAG: hypothetical protein R3200_04050 [Xanthomonadales bacterium]|nr:hypothetical protein [Xanthomonadales bacterium]